MKVLLIIAIAGIGANAVQAQSAQKPKTDPKRAAHWNPEKGKYYFSHVLIYEYLIKADSTKGEFRVYIDPVTGTMGFRKESSFGGTDEMNEAIVARPNGQVIAYGKNEDGKQVKSTYQNEGVVPHPDDVKFQAEAFKEQCVPTGRSRKEFGWEIAEHVLSFVKTGEKAKLWLAQVPFNVYPLYAFDEWGGEAQLPIPLSFTYVLGPRQLITELDDPFSSLKLIGYEHEPLLLDVSKYVKE